MNDNLLESKEISTQTCNAFGCDNIATVKIVLNIGYKTISLVVCENCRPKLE
jgi:hypothetical protein